MKNVKLLVVGSAADPVLEPLITPPPGVEICYSQTLDEVAETLQSVTAALLWKPPAGILDQLLRSAPALEWVHHSSAGIEDIISPELLSSKVVLTNSAGVYAGSLGEWVLAGMLFFSKQLRRLLVNQHERRWEQFDVDELRGRTVLIVGYGGIGRAVAQRAAGMGMTVLAVRNRAAAATDSYAHEVASIDALEKLLPRSDFLVVSTPLTDRTRGLIGERQLRLLKPHAVIINVGRGPVIQEKALLEALQSGRIRGAALDVFDTEPLPPEHPFYRLENVLLSPHSADHTATWRHEALALFLENLKSFRLGRPLKNITNPAAGY